ncbi:conserved hypothetical protein [Thiomonas arsenitoxydans]|uniref:Uncharacterized protein n=1 Tax=Thiomonas arsenitoxydans (strain DSM 22701 / CIP 110005 / 3As) TaxID=426114 RepID=D6CPS8_THIA3|nr:hypothetical protein THI_1319 [Thiomonas arsenitoxydans]CQR31682.1 conserved hypothetical protein [Thiomonas arsenitoxydans]CQR34778.1 conserved hypothetical protein [Thiomonas arsenitoxydans]CQR40946.1 conserved hypothetical protein [Thiomonas arsenitoxydans]
MREHFHASVALRLRESQSQSTRVRFPAIRRKAHAEGRRALCWPDFS